MYRYGVAKDGVDGTPGWQAGTVVFRARYAGHQETATLGACLHRGKLAKVSAQGTPGYAGCNGNIATSSAPPYPLTLLSMAPPVAGALVGHHATPHDAIRARYGDQGSAQRLPCTALLLEAPKVWRAGAGTGALVKRRDEMTLIAVGMLLCGHSPRTEA
jgi:hypothetical protein